MHITYPMFTLFIGDFIKNFTNNFKTLASVSQNAIQLHNIVNAEHGNATTFEGSTCLMSMGNVGDD